MKVVELLSPKGTPFALKLVGSYMYREALRLLTFIGACYISETSRLFGLVIQLLFTPS